MIIWKDRKKQQYIGECWRIFNAWYRSVCTVVDDDEWMLV